MHLLSIRSQVVRQKIGWILKIADRDQEQWTKTRSEISNRMPKTADQRSVPFFKSGTSELEECCWLTQSKLVYLDEKRPYYDLIGGLFECDGRCGADRLPYTVPDSSKFLRLDSFRVFKIRFWCSCSASQELHGNHFLILNMRRMNLDHLSTIWVYGWSRSDIQWLAKSSFLFLNRQTWTRWFQHINRDQIPRPPATSLVQ